MPTMPDMPSASFISITNSSASFISITNSAKRAAAPQLPARLAASHSAGMAGYNMSVIAYAAGFG